MTVGNMDNAELFDTGKKGRGLRAAKELNTGDVVFAEASFSAVVFDRYESYGCIFINWMMRELNEHLKVTLGVL